MMNNPELVATAQSDAAKHGIGYCLATTFMGIPQFWAMPHMMSPGAKAEFTKELALYNAHRKNIVDGYVFPVGARPDNASWTGFQSVDDPSAKSGYLTMFRELNNPDASSRLRLRFPRVLAGKNLEIEDLRRGTRSMVSSDREGAIALRIEKPADFLFLRYRLAE